jgi:hypothetical protein
MLKLQATLLCCYPRLCSRASAQHTPRSDRGPEREVEVKGDADIAYYMHRVIYKTKRCPFTLERSVLADQWGSAIDQGG